MRERRTPSHRLGPASRPLPPLTGDTFLRRSIRTAIVLCLLIAMFAAAIGGATAAWSLLAGCGVSLFSMATIRWVVGRWLQGEAPQRRGVVLAFAVKHVLLLGALVGVAYGVAWGVLAPFWLFGGFALLHLVMVLKLVSRALIRAAGGAERDAEQESQPSRW